MKSIVFKVSSFMLSVFVMLFSFNINILADEEAHIDDVKSILQKKDWCWAASAQMMVNKYLNENGIDRVIGHSKEILDNKYDDFLNKIKEYNKSCSDALITDDDIEQAILVYMVKDEIVNEGGDDNDVILGIMKILNQIQNSDYIMKRLVFRGDMDYEVRLRLIFKFAQNSFYNNWPITFNRDDNHWRLLIGIDMNKEEIKIRDPNTKEIILNSTQYLNRETVNFIGSANEDYCVAPVRVAIGEGRTNIFACTNENITILSENGNSMQINLNNIGNQNEKTYVKLSTCRLLDGKINRDEKYIYIGRVELNSGKYKVVNGFIDKNYKDIDAEVFEVYSDEEMYNNSSDSEIVSWSDSRGIEYSSNVTYHFDSEGGRENTTDNSQSKDKDDLFGENNASAPVNMLQRPVPNLRYQVNSQNSLIDVKKAFSSVLGVKDNTIIEFIIGDNIWNFESKNIIQDVNKWENFNMQISVDDIDNSNQNINEKIIDFFKNRNSKIISFDKGKIFPGLANVSIRLAEECKGKNFAVYYLNDNGQNAVLKRLTDTVFIDDKGILKIAVNHGCSIILVNKNLINGIPEKLNI